MIPARLLLCVVLFTTANLHAETAWSVGPLNIPGATYAYSIAFGNGRFVVTLSGKGSPAVASSVDGATWTASETPGLAQQGTVIFDHGVFTLAADTTVWRSTDGEHWTPVFTYAPSPYVSFRGIATDGRTMMIGSANANTKVPLFSSDLLTWKTTAPLPISGPTPTSIVVEGILYFGRRYYVAYSVDFGSSRRTFFASTTDGQEWTPVPSLDGYDGYWWAAGNGRLLAYSGRDVISTTDGVTFTRSPLSAALPTGIANGGPMTYAGGRFFFLGSLYASTDGATWAPLAEKVSSANLAAMAYGNGRYVAVGYVSDFNSSPVVTTPLAFRLTASAPPIVRTPLSDTTAVLGRPASLSVTLENPDTSTTFQWRHDGVSIAGATTAVYTIASTGTADAGLYAVTVTNAQGTITTEPVRLTVAPVSAEGRIANISVLSSLDAGDDALTIGFVLGPAGAIGSKSLLVRAGGPSLAGLGVADPNPDPKLELFSGAGRVADNDDWAGSPKVLATAQRLGAYAYTGTTSRDAAVVAEMSGSQGATATITSAARAAGTVLGEVYDAMPAEEFTTTSPRLINVSALRSISATGSLTAGFVLTGVTSRTVLIRAIGPSLWNLGVPSPLADPKFALYRAGTAAPVLTNDNWGGTIDLVRAFLATGAFGLVGTSRDAAAVIPLQPGAYTVQVTSASNTGGTVLIEVYEVP